MKLPTLYTIDKMSRVRLWTIEVEGDKYRTTEGLQNGTLSTSQWTRATAKNVGKASHRTAEQQALAEAKAKWQKKVDLGAAEDAADCGAQFIEPMLAHKWSHTLDGTRVVYLQPKLDGHRCLIYLRDGKPYAQSRKGKQIHTVKHVLRLLKPLLTQYPDLVLDGEIYNHALRADFGELSGLIRRQNPSVSDDVRSEQVLQFHCYDGFMRTHMSQTFDARFRMVSRLLMELDGFRENGSVVLVQTLSSASQLVLDEYEQRCVDDGYEGIMVRAGSAGYCAGRTTALLKVKRFEDAEFEIIDVQEGKGDRQGLATRAYVRDPESDIVSGVGVMGKDAVVREMFKNRAQLIGRQATVVFQGRTEDGLLRFGKLKEVRPEGF